MRPGIKQLAIFLAVQKNMYKSRNLNNGFNIYRTVCSNFAQEKEKESEKEENCQGKEEQAGQES